MAAIDSIGDGNAWVRRITYMRPENVLELGTGQGASGNHIMSALLPTSKFTTINYNYPPEYCFGEQLNRWKSDPRLKCVVADTCDPDTLKQVPDGVDLMFIDSTHRAWHAAIELCLWQDKLQDGAVVIVDDLDQHNMMRFWDSLPYEKVIHTDGRQGTFRYDDWLRYAVVFPRGKTSREGREE